MSAQVLKMAAAGDENTEADVVKVTFDDFWRVYPRRVAKKDALKAWQKIDAATYPKIVEAVQKVKKTEDWKRDGGRFIPYPASYLNGERWEDELDADVTMGECQWNRNGNREYGKPKCTKSAVKEKNGVPYCQEHIARVGG